MRVVLSKCIDQSQQVLLEHFKIPLVVLLEVEKQLFDEIVRGRLFNQIALHEYLNQRINQ